MSMQKVLIELFSAGGRRFHHPQESPPQRRSHVERTRIEKDHVIRQLERFGRRVSRCRIAIDDSAVGQNGKGVKGFVLRREVSDRKGVDPTAQEYSAWHVGHELKLHRILEQIAIAMYVCLAGQVAAGHSAGLGRRFPVDALVACTGFQLDLKVSSRRKVMYAFKEGGRLIDGMRIKHLSSIFQRGSPIELLGNNGMSQHCFDFRAEDKNALIPIIEQRLHPEAVATEVELGL